MRGQNTHKALVSRFKEDKLVDIEVPEKLRRFSKEDCLIALAGPPGVGKTTLARNLGQNGADYFSIDKWRFLAMQKGERPNEKPWQDFFNALHQSGNKCVISDSPGLSKKERQDLLQINKNKKVLVILNGGVDYLKENQGKRNYKVKERSILSYKEKTDNLKTKDLLKEGWDEVIVYQMPGFKQFKQI